MPKEINYNEQPVSTRVQIAGLWTSMLFVFAYVDIFAFFRADIIEGSLAGNVGEFDASQTFLALTTLYIMIPCIVLFLTLVLEARKSRMLNIIVSTVYIVTIIGAVVGETWTYYIMGSIVEVVLLLAIIRTSMAWPKG